MKILHVAETIKGGVATVLRQLIAFQLLDSEVTVLIPDSQLTELDNIEGINSIYFKRTGRNFMSFFSLFFKFIYLVIKVKPDIIHIHSSFAGVICRLALILIYPLRRTKVVYCPHAFSFLMTTSARNRKIYIYVERFLQIITSKIICVSKYEYDQAVRYGLAIEKLVVIYNGVKEYDKNIYVDPYLNHQKINLLFIGRFDYQKGFDILLEVMPKLNNCHLTAIGDFVINKSLISAEQANISYKGWMNYEKIVPYLYYCDAVIVPSRWEGFAMVPLEGMSFSKPIIAANTTSLPEVVENGKTGYLFTIDDLSNVIKLLATLQRNHLKGLGINGYHKYKKSFTAKKMLRDVEDLYKSLIKNKL